MCNLIELLCHLIAIVTVIASLSNSFFIVHLVFV